MKAVITNFTAGEISPKVQQRIDLGLYSRAAAELTNFAILPQGGITLRPGTVCYRENEQAQVRIIPYIIDHDTSYLLIFQAGSLIVTDCEGNETSSIPTTYTAASLMQLQFTQTYNAVYIFHEDYPPQRLRFISHLNFSWETLNFVCSQEQDGEAISASEINENTFNGVGNYPKAGAFFDGRLYLAGTKNNSQTVWASSVETFDDGVDTWQPWENFLFWNTIEQESEVLTDPSTWADPSEPETETITNTRDITTEGHAFRFDIASEENDAILSMTAGRNLIIRTTTGEWTVPGGTNPLTVAAVLETRYGSPRIQGRLIGNLLFFPSGPQMFAYQYNAERGNHFADDMTFTADHISGGSFQQMEYTQDPYPTLYALREDGKVAVYMHYPQTGLSAWSVYDFGGTVQSLAVVTMNNRDTLFLAVERGGTVYLEYMGYLFPDSQDEEIHVDCATIKPVGETSASHIGPDDYYWTSVNGIYSSGGEVSGEDLAGNSADIVVRGLPMTGTFKSLSLDSIGQALVVGKEKGIRNAILRVYRTSRLRVGQREDHMEEAVIEDTWFTGDVRAQILTTFDNEGCIIVESVFGGALTITSIIAEVVDG